MKKVVFLVLMAIAMCSCEEKKHLVENNKIGENGDYEIVRIDGCQYISFKVYTWGYWSAGLIHKGNCENPIHSK